MSDIRRKASKLLRGLAAVLKKPALLNHVLDHEDQHETQFKQNSGMQNGFPEVQLRHLMSGEVSVKPFAFLDGGSLPTDLALLKNSIISTDDQAVWHEVSIAIRENPVCQKQGLQD